MWRQSHAEDTVPTGAVPPIPYARPANDSAAMAASKPVPVVWIECPHYRSVIQRTLRYLRSTPGLWCETCVKWAANEDIKIVDVRMAGDRRKLNGGAPRRPASFCFPSESHVRRI